MNNSYSLFSRFLHWGFALFFAVAYLSGEDFPFFIHLVAGLGFLIFLAVKLGWMFASDDLANIKRFHFSGLKEFVKQLLHMQKGEQNHNPLSSFVTVLILTSALATILSGFLLLIDKEFWFTYGHDLKELHEFFANLTLFAVLAHITGVIVDTVIFKHQTYKKILVGSAKFDKKSIAGVGILVLLSGVGFWIYGIFSNIPIQDRNSLYAKECASCHFAYPKELYSAKSWQNIMANLDNHYGDSAELDNNISSKILTYLTSVGQNQKSKTVFGEFEIDGIKESIITNEKFKRVHRHLAREDMKSSCIKCHTDAASGAFRLANIRKKEENLNVENNFNRGR